MEQIVDMIWNTGGEIFLCFIGMIVLCVLIDLLDISDFKRGRYNV